eukprot:scaffold3108_cov152-Cylindrotheca_fusiformis.AAC.22
MFALVISAIPIATTPPFVVTKTTSSTFNHKFCPVTDIVDGESLTTARLHLTKGSFTGMRTLLE